MASKSYSTELDISQGINVDVANSLVIVKGPKGQLQRNFLNPRIKISKEENKIIFKCKQGMKFSQNDKMIMNTYKAHIKNMFFGAVKGYTAKLKICSGHFPMNINVDGSNVVIKNFLGEKVPRKAKILDGVNVQVQGDIIIVKGLDKEKVGQTAATIEQTTRITDKDRRIFQDGCFIISKPGEEDE
ncbi:50S ribosomal protein L6 [Candidatus Woesearchaeota archaeon]|nr:50S ribosomal protein L6 [Candidatus Woesearchaeota archaeon]